MEGDGSALPSAAKVQGWLPPSLRRQLARTKSSRLAFAEGVGMVASGVRAAFMLDYASPETEELVAFLRAARAEDKSMAGVGAMRVDQMVLLINLTLMCARIRASGDEPGLFVNIHRSLETPHVCSVDEAADTIYGLSLVLRQLSEAITASRKTEDEPCVVALGEEVWEQVYGPALLGFLLEFPVVYTTHPRASATETNCLGLIPLQVHTVEAGASTGRGGQRRTVMRYSVPEVLDTEEVVAQALERHRNELTTRCQRAGLSAHHKKERVSLDRVVL